MQRIDVPRDVAVALDGSRASHLALEFALALARPWGSRLLLVSVVPITPEYTRHPDLAQPLVHRLVEDARGYLEQGRGAARDRGVDSESILLEGYPAGELCRFIEGRKPGLTVLGSRGLNDRGAQLMGSVGYAVARFATSPVLIARTSGPLRRILVPVDASPIAATAVAWAGEIAKAQGASPTLLYVIPQRQEEVKFSVSRGIIEPFLSPLGRWLEERGLKVDRRVEYGHPADVIVAKAEEEGFDLIVLGERGAGASGLQALGGIADKVLHHASCPVLVVR